MYPTDTLQCAALNCESVTSESCQKSFHLFPKDAVLQQCWLLQMKQKNYWPSETAVLCSDHFEQSCFKRTGQTTRLTKDAVPTLFKTTQNLKKQPSVSLQPVLRAGLYKCNKCKYSTDRKPNWYKHRNKHLGIRRHCCTECNYKATTSSNLKRHLAIHSDVRAFKCLFCSNSFRQKIHLDKHILYKHKHKRPKFDPAQILSHDELNKLSFSKIGSKESSFPGVNLSHVKESQLNSDFFNQDGILKPIQIWTIPENSVPLLDDEEDPPGSQQQQQQVQYSQQAQYSQEQVQYSQQDLQSSQDLQYSQDVQSSQQETQCSQQTLHYSQQDYHCPQEEVQYLEHEDDYPQQKLAYIEPEPQYSQHEEDEEVSPLVEYTAAGQSKKVHIVAEHQYHMMDSLAQLWKKGRLCDAAIGNGSSIVMVHKIVLIALCPKLLSTNDTRYNQFLVVNLPNSVSSEALHAFAEYIYKGHLNLDPDLLTQLETIALCLEIADLKQLCDTERGVSSPKVQPCENKNPLDPAADTITVTFHPPKKQLLTENQVNFSTSSSFSVSTSSQNPSVMKSQTNFKIKTEDITDKAPSTHFMTEESNTNKDCVLTHTPKVREVYVNFQAGNNDFIDSPSTGVCEEQNLRNHCSKSAAREVNLEPYSYLPSIKPPQAGTDSEPLRALSHRFNKNTTNIFSESNQPKRPLESAVKVEPVIIDDDDDDDDDDSEGSLLPSPSATFRMDSSNISTSRPIEDNLTEILNTNSSSSSIVAAMEEPVTNNHCQESNNNATSGINFLYQQEQDKLCDTTINNRHKGNPSFVNSQVFRSSRNKFYIDGD